MTRLLIAAAACVAMMTLPALACKRPAGAAQMEADLLAAVNAVRQGRGLSPLTVSDALDQAAQAHACDIAARRTTSHVSADGGTIVDRLNRVGYRYKTASENTGRGFTTATGAVDWWMNSSGHKKNILMRKTRDAGIGIAVSAAPESRLHWVLDMGASN